jgi:hypothetical protein
VSDGPLVDYGADVGPSWPREDGGVIGTDDYRGGLDILTAAARIVLLVDVQPMLDYLSRVETLGPVLDPTAYLRGSRNLRDQRELLEAAAAFRAALERIRARLPGDAPGVRLW